MSGQNDFDAWQEAMLDGLSLLARLYWGPDRELCTDLRGEAVGELLAELTGLLPAAAPSLRSLSLYLAGQASPAALCAELAPAHEALFLGQGGPAPAPLHHSRYVGDGRLLGPPADNMAARLEAEDLALEERPGEPPDHLAVEIEYLAYLLEEAWSGGRPGGEAEAAEFAGRFMLPWVREFAARQEPASPSPVFPLAAKLLVALLEDLAA
jgi:putative dimethyl sulfoxide reductase chaperone